MRNFMKNKSTHFVFDGSKVVISPDLHRVVNFLQEIEKEVDSILGFDKKLESIKKQHRETLGLIETLTKKLKENSLEFKLTLSEHPSTMADKLIYYNPIRFQMVALFAYLEVLLRLNYAYDNKIDDGERIRKIALKPKVWKDFYNDYCLSQGNEWVKENSERAKHITAKEFRYLRNSLTHFLSVDVGIQIMDDHLNDKARRLEKRTKFKMKFISPQDLYEIIKGVAILMIKKWSDDCQKCLQLNSNEFKEKILSVNKLIEKSASIVVKSKQINI